MDCWYAVYCKPRQELVAQENLLRQGYHVYLPRIQIRKRLRGKWVEVVEALFPRYIFIRIDSERCSTGPVRSTRGAVDLVCFGGQPSVIPDEMMEALFHREDTVSGFHRDSRPLFSAGATVRMVDGPLAGMEGIFVQEDGEERVFVLMELLGKTNKISVGRDSVTEAA